MKKILMMLILSLIVLSSCSRGETTEISDNELNIYGWAPTVNSSDVEYFEEWASDLMGDKVEVLIPAQSNDMYLTASISAGDNYDLIYIDQAEYYSLVEQGALLDVTDEISSSVVGNHEYVESLSVDGKIYAYPIYYPGYSAPMVREDWLEEFGMAPPTTLDEWEQYFKNCKEIKGAYGVSFNSLRDVQPFMDANGVNAGITKVEDTYTIEYASDEAIEVWEWLADMCQKGYINPNYETATQAEVNEQFVNDATGCIVQNVNTISKIENYGIEVLYIPPVNNYYYESMELLAIPENSNNPALAKEFMDIWYSEEGSDLLSFGYLGYTYTVEDGEKIETEYFEDFERIYESKVHPVDYTEPQNVENILLESNWSDISTIIYKYGASIMKGEISADEGVQKMQKEINASEKNEYKYTF